MRHRTAGDRESPSLPRRAVQLQQRSCRLPMHSCSCAHCGSIRPMRTTGRSQRCMSTSDWRCDAPLNVSVRPASHGRGPTRESRTGGRSGRRTQQTQERQTEGPLLLLQSKAYGTVCSGPAPAASPTLKPCALDRRPSARPSRTVLVRALSLLLAVGRCAVRTCSRATAPQALSKRDGLSSPHAPSCPSCPPHPPIAAAAGSPSP